MDRPRRSNGGERTASVMGKTATLTADTINDTGNTGGSPLFGSTSLAPWAYPPTAGRRRGPMLVEAPSKNLVQTRTKKSSKTTLPLLSHQGPCGRSSSAGAYYLNFSKSVSILHDASVDGENTVISDAIRINILSMATQIDFYIEGI